MDEYDHTIGNLADWKHWTWEAGRAAREAEDELERTVIRAKLAGCTWEEIAQALTVSRQAAWERFSPAYKEVAKDRGL